MVCVCVCHFALFVLVFVDVTARHRLAKLNEKLTMLERKMEYIEHSVKHVHEMKQSGVGNQ